MVIPARRFRTHDIVVSEKTISDKQKSDNKSKYLSKNQPQLFNMVDFVLKDALKIICDNKFFGAIYLVNGLKLEGYFCDFDDQVIILTFSDNNKKQMVYHHAIATIQI
ncbi:MAG: RNA chaperone Hfq [Gammaproteobacteria bacterium]|jgi:RNA chaperone Hfq